MSVMENETEPKVKRARDNDDSVSEREGNEDRLSDLPDCVLIHLMTFMTAKDSVSHCLVHKMEGLVETCSFSYITYLGQSSSTIGSFQQICK